MDFFTSQDLARRKTKWLVFYFILALIGIILSVYLLFLAVFGYAVSGVAADPWTAMERELEPARVAPAGPWWWQPELLLVVTAGVLVVVGGASLFKAAELRSGGETIAAALGGRLVDANTTDPHERQLVNVVEEMALATGTSVPPVYVMDREQGINAFAAGFSPNDAVVGVTRGTIEQLNRDELQGVIAHEFSHIFNGDMRMNLRLIGWLFGIQVLAVIGFWILRVGVYSGGGRSRDGRGGAAAILALGLGLLVIGSVGLFFTRLIKSAISRQREYLADASAVQFTRNPEGIGGALKMIGAHADGSQVKSPQAEVASHMYFANMFSWNVASLFSTHPPLKDRVRRIEPSFDGDYTSYLRQRAAGAAETARRAQRQPEAASQRGFGLGRKILPGEIGQRFPIDPVLLIAGVGLPTDGDVRFARQALQEIPESLTTAIHDPYSAHCVAYAMLLDEDPEIRQRQREIIAANEGSGVLREADAQRVPLQQLDERLRLPLLEILQATLRRISESQFRQFRATIEALTQADQRLSLSELIITHMLVKHLQRHFDPQRHQRVAFRSISAISGELSKLLAAFAAVGSTDESEVRRAYTAAVGALQDTAAHLPSQMPAFRPEDIEYALSKLEAASADVKRAALTAAATAIGTDGRITVQEAELFRAVAETLECPVPPMILYRAVQEA